MDNVAGLAISQPYLFFPLTHVVSIVVKWKSDLVLNMIMFQLFTMLFDGMKDIDRGAEYG